jgi:hypothetical protein
MEKDDRITIRIGRDDTEKLRKILKTFNITPSKFLREYIVSFVDSIPGENLIPCILETSFLISAKNVNF